MKLQDEKLNFIYENINNIFPLNAMVTNSKNNIIKRVNTIDLPKIIKDEENEIVSRMAAIMVKGPKELIYHIESSKGLRYMGFGIYEEESYEGVFILGPYLEDVIPNVLLGDEERFFYESITVINKSEQKALANIINTLNNAERVTKAIIEEDDSNLGIRRFNYTLDEYEKDLTNIRKIYKTERQILHYVSQGNKAMANEIFAKETYERIEAINRFPDNPIRNVKNIGVVLNTLLRKAAEHGGVDEYFIHTTSENFALRIENSLTIRELMNLMAVMVEDYSDLVNEYNTKVYSELISNAITYIKLNFKREISLANIAIELFIHPTYLAKKFKQETGKTVSEYINEIRIKEAQFIIMVTEFKIEDIAYHVGYNDKKYFSKTFKKFVGISPSEYRKYNNEK